MDFREIPPAPNANKIEYIKTNTAEKGSWVGKSTICVSVGAQSFWKPTRLLYFFNIIPSFMH